MTSLLYPLESNDVDDERRSESKMLPLPSASCLGAAALILLWIDLLKLYRRLGYHPSTQTH
jgi:hypothetical protein